MTTWTHPMDFVHRRRWTTTVGPKPRVIVAVASRAT
jgi:hypothetical protein